MERGAAEKHLHYLFDDLEDDERIELRALAVANGTGTKQPPQREWFSSIPDALDWAEGYHETRDVYVGVLPRRAGAGGGNGAVTRFTTIWLDMDFKNDFDESLRRRQLDELGDRATFLVCSGGGLHPYWMFEDSLPQSKASVRQCQEIMRHLSETLGCDQVADPARILRLAGTLNHKYVSPRPVTIEPQGLKHPFTVILGDLGPPGVVPVTDSPQEPGAAPAPSTAAPMDTSGMSQPSAWDRTVMNGLPAGGGTINGYTFEGRNKTLYVWAHRRRDEGCLEWIAATMALGFNKRNRPPLPDDEVLRTVHSAYVHEVDVQIGEVTSPTQRPLVIFHEELPEPQPIRWLQEPYLPQGRLLLVDGEEGIGKGLFCAWVAAQYAEHGVLWMAAEDDPTDDIRPRVDTAARYLGLSVPSGKIGYVDPNLRFNSAEPREFELLRDLVAKEQPKVLIMDPGRSFIRPRADAREFSNNAEADIRPTLEMFARCARAWDLCLVFVHHWNKAFGSPTKYRTTGSGAYRQVVRHCISLARDDDTGDGAFAVTKSNIAELGHLQGYVLEEVDGWPVFQPTGPMSGVESFEAWYRRPKTRIELEGIDPVEVLRDYCAQTFARGEKLPPREQLRRFAALSQDDIKEAAAALIERGTIKQTGNARYWIGEPEEGSEGANNDEISAGG